MSIRFVIKNTEGSPIKEGNTIVRYTGVSEKFIRHSDRYCKKIGVDGGGNPRLVFTTGLDDKAVKFYSWYSEEERSNVAKTIKDLRKTIEDFYGKEVLESTNQFFWKDDKNVGRLSLRNENIDMFYDTENAPHALLYLSIISGAFIDLVAPTKDWAERHQIPHYMALEIENDVIFDDDKVTRSDAHGALSDLRKNHGREALYILAWCLQYDTNAFGAYNHSTREKDLVAYHIRYIDGELVTKKKRNTAKNFLEYYNKWIGQQTRPQLYTEAYIKAGEYFNLILQREKKYNTLDGDTLGSTIQESVSTLMSPKMTSVYEKLRDQVEAKWKE
jgi:hypothetical protein